MRVILMAPHFPSYQRNFVRALREVGAEVAGIGDWDFHNLDPEMREWLCWYEYVPNLCDEASVFNAVRKIQSIGWVDRMEATIEAHMLVAAKVREATHIPGLSYHSTVLCRDKFKMKEHLRKHGIPCAATAELESTQDAKDFAQQYGFPVIIKPREAAGALGTTRCDNDGDIARACQEMAVGRGGKASIEEFVSGHEGFHDTLTCNGEVKFEAISHYYPNVLEAMRTRWINPQIVTTNRIAAEGYNQLRHFGREVVKSLGLTTCATHMEWFFGPKGLFFSEIGARPPGVRFWDIYAWANDFDIYREWAKAICFNTCDPQPSRRYSAGLISIRASQDGTVKGITGLDAVKARCGNWLGEVRMPAVGSRAAAVEGGYNAGAYLWVRHPDYDECRRMLDYVGQTLKVWAE